MGLVAKAFQDIITFSRASSGTYVNSNGYITNSSVLNYLTYSNQPENAAWTKSNSFVQQNLLTYSQELNNAAWSKVGVTVAGADINATIAPDGTLTADKIAEDATTSVHAIYQGYSAVSGTIYTMSFYAKAAERTWVRTRGEIGINYFNLAAGTVGTTAGGVTATIIAVGNGWYRCIATKAAAITGATNSQIAPTTADNVDSYAGTAGSGIYIWGAQIVQGSVPGDYRATTSAALPCLYADYNGALRARKLCEDATNNAHALGGSGALTAGQTYTFSTYMKAGERTFGYLQINDGVSNAAYTSFNLTNGTVALAPTAIIGTFAGMTSSITPAANGYYRVQFTIVASITATYATYISVSNNGTTRVYTGDGSSGIYIADAQLNDGSSALAYYDTTASAYNAPRFDYDPATLAAKGLLVEESRANLLLQSNDFFTSWAPTNITRTLNSTLSPSGNVDGVKIAATAAAGTNLIQAATVAATSATFSVYVKQGTGPTTANVFLLRNNTSATNLVGGTLNYSTGVFTYTTGSTGVVISNAGNGWWRVQISSTTGITSGDAMGCYVGFTGGVPAAGDFLYAYGAQLEQGAFATSYIPTVASQVTRAADVASVNTLSPWYNGQAGTWYVEADTQTYPRYLVFDGGGASKFPLYVHSGSSNIGTFDGTNLTLTSNATTATVVFKAAATFGAGAAKAVLNGGTVATGTNNGSFSTIASFSFSNSTGGSGSINGHFRRVTFYPRVLTNAELQTLTTL